MSSDSCDLIARRRVVGEGLEVAGDDRLVDLAVDVRVVGLGGVDGRSFGCPCCRPCNAVTIVPCRGARGVGRSSRTMPPLWRSHSRDRTIATDSAESTLTIELRGCSSEHGAKRRATRISRTGWCPARRGWRTVAPRATGVAARFRRLLTRIERRALPWLRRRPSVSQRF